jgi:hypothetical protein
MSRWQKDDTSTVAQDRHQGTRNERPRSTHAKCMMCGRGYDTRDSAERFAGMTEDPLLWNEVVAKLVARYGATFWEAVCDEEAQRLSDQARGGADWDDPYHILSETEEQYGREYKSPGRIQPLMVRVRRGASTEDPQTQEENTNMTEQPNGDQYTEPGDEQHVTTETAETAEPAEAPKPTVTNVTANLADEFQKGTKVEITTKGSDVVGYQGEVMDPPVVNKRGTNYLRVQLKVAPKGARVAEENQREVHTRRQSVTVIEDYRAEPVQPQVATPAPEPVSVEG